MSFVHAEIVGDFVPDGVLDYLGQVVGAAGHALVGALEDRDAVGHREGLEDAARGERAAFVESQERASAGDAAAGELVAGGLVGDQEGDVLHALPETRGNPAPGVGDETVEVVGRIGRSHPCCYSNFLAETKPRRVVVAIDGPAGAGKSTIAKRLAERLQFTYIDTGAMYRAVALWAVRQNVAFEDMHRMEQLAIAAEIELAPGKISLNGEDVTQAIRTPDVSNGASKIAVIPGVRRAMVDKQREMGDRTSVVMEGRDIGTVVFPNADVKVYLDADLRERVRRRLEEVRAKGDSITEETLAAQMAERDRRDSTRSDAPLAQAPDAVYLDSTGMSIEDVEEAILRIVRHRVSNGKEVG